MTSRNLMRQQPTKPMILKNCAICRQIISMRKILIMAGPFLSFPSNYVLQRHLAVKASPHSWYLTPYMQNLFPFVPAITL